MMAHWGFADPAAVKGTREEIARAFRETFTVIDRGIGLFLSLLFTTFEDTAVKAKSAGLVDRRSIL